MLKNQIIVITIDDLFFHVRVETAFERAGHSVKLLAGSQSGMDEIWQSLDGVPALWVFDLSLLDMVESRVGWVKSNYPECKIICFGSHVDAASFVRARAAGVDDAYARSRFMQILPELASMATPTVSENK